VGLLRNAIAALAGKGDAEATAALEHALSDAEDIVRHAALERTSIQQQGY
jgi:HEAT repeat protein